MVDLQASGRDLVIITSQHGCVKNKPFQTNLIFFNKVTSWVNEGNVVDTIYMDFSKAFVKSCIDILISKLEMCD